MVLFQGKRAAQRVRLELPVACSAATGASVAAKTVDLSTTGALLRLQDPRALGISAEASLAELAARIAMRFPGGILLQFQGALGDQRGRVVRVASPPPPDSGVLVGVRFERHLSATEAERLGLPTAPDPGSPAAGAIPGTPATAAPAARVATAPAPAEVAPAAGAPDAGTRATGGGTPVAPPLQVDPRVERDDPRPRPTGISIVGGTTTPPTPPHPAPAAINAPPLPAPSPSSRPVAAPLRTGGDAATVAAAETLASDVLVYLLPAHAAAPSARVRARTLRGDGLDLVAEVALPANESDPMGVGAFLGEHPRLVLVHGGRVAYDGPVRVDRMIPEAGGALRLLLKAERPLPVEIAPARRGPQPPDVRARQMVNRV